MSNGNESELCKFRNIYFHFMDLCYTEWVPNLPYDESRNIILNVKIKKKNPYVMTIIKDSKEIILRDVSKKWIFKFGFFGLFF